MDKNKFFITTSSLESKDYETIDVIMALGVNLEGNFSITGDVKIDPAFDRLKKEMELKCKKVGGDAVINCSFNHRVVESENTFIWNIVHKLTLGLIWSPTKNRLELMWYGTVVKLK